MPIKALVQSLALFRRHQLSLEVCVIRSDVLEESVSIAHVDAAPSNALPFAQFSLIRGYLKPIFLVQLWRWLSE